MAKQKPAPLSRSAAIHEMSMRMDDWFNAATDLGVLGKDKRRSGAHELELLAPSDAMALYRGDGLAARIVETPADHLVREGWEAAIQDDGEDSAEDVDKALDDLEAAAAVHEALCYARASGGSALLLGADDGQKDLSQPLDLKRVRSFEWMNVLSALELQPADWYRNPVAKDYGKPMIYRVIISAVPGTISSTRSARTAQKTFAAQQEILVHESRLIRFDGVRIPRAQAVAQNGWHDSVLTRCAPVLRDYGLSWGTAGTLLQEFGQAVLKVKGLFELLNAGPSGDEAVVRRAAAARIARSVANMMLIDSEEEFEHKAISMAGLPEMLREFTYRLASVADMPVSLLMGQAPAGLNATGDSDIRWFYDRISALQERMLRPRINRLMAVLFAAKSGPTKGKTPENWSVRFTPLWQPSPVEQAEIRFQQAQADQIYINTQVVTPEEIAVSRFGGDEYSTDTVIDLQNRPAPVLPQPGAPALPTRAGAPGQPRRPGAPAPGSRPVPEPGPSGGAKP